MERPDIVERLRAEAKLCVGWSANEAADEIERLRNELIEEREENLWNAYHTGYVKDGRWSHMFMSDGEALAQQCGFNPREGDYPDADIRAAIPEAAKRAIQLGAYNAD